MLLFRTALRTNACRPRRLRQREAGARGTGLDVRAAVRRCEDRRWYGDPLSGRSGEAGGGDRKVHIISDMEGVGGIVQWQQ